MYVRAIHNEHQGRVVWKEISANPGLKFNRLVCSTWQLKLKLSKAKHFIVCMISEQKYSNIFVYIYNFVHKISTNPGANRLLNNWPLIDI